MFESKCGITGQVAWKAVTFPEEALNLFAELRDKYPGRDEDIGEYKAYNKGYDKVHNEYATQKYHKKNWFRSVFNLDPLPMLGINHNIVTNRGDAFVNQAMITTRTETPVDNTYGRMGVGTGFSSEAKTVDALVTQVGTDGTLEATYPKSKGAFEATDDNVTQYRTIFATGSLASTGIDECILTNGTNGFSYAEISAAIDVASTDSLQLDWEITYLGA